MIGLFSDPQYGPLDLIRGELSSSIQFPGDVINILLTSFSRSVLEVTVPGFSTSIHGRLCLLLGP